MTNQAIIETDLSTQDLAIHIKNQHFADFILNFLGKKEKLSYEDIFSFELNHNDIEQFYYLLDAKISKEQNVVIQHFLVTVVYNDNTKREISGIKSLNDFLETRYVYAVSVNLTWNIIVNFPNSESIENQTIELAFMTNEGCVNQVPIEYREDYKQIHKESDGKVLLNIYHTNQAWGIEVLNLIKDKIQACILVKPLPYIVANNLKKIFNYRNFTVFITLVMLATMVTLLFKVEAREQLRSGLYYDIVSEAPRSEFQDTVISLFAVRFMGNEALEKTSKNLIKSAELKNRLLDLSKQTKSELSVFGTVVLSSFLLTIGILGITFYINYVIKYYGSNSYILITDRATTTQKAEVKKKSKLEFYSLTTIAITLVLAIVGNWIYSFLI